MHDNTVGYLAMLVSALGFGSNFVPVKKCQTGNGLAFQFFFCWGVWLVGLGVGAYRGFPKAPPLALLGGALWCTGNLLSVPAIKLIGLGLSLLLWGISNMCAGWASGTFGLFGLTAQSVSNPPLNYSGVAVAVVALLIYLLVKPTDSASAAKPSSSSSSYSFLSRNNKGIINNDSYRSSLLIEEEGGQAPPSLAAPAPSATGRDEHGADVFLPSLKGPKRFVVGISAALLAGLFFGCSFNPAYYILDHAVEEGSAYAEYKDLEMIDFVFPHFNGIFFTSSAYFLLYLAVYRLSCRRASSASSPLSSSSSSLIAPLYPATLVPSLFSGLLWAVAMVGWFIANSHLPLSITFPIVTSTPGLIASLWGVLVFGEIKGRRNLLTLGGAFLLTLTACLLIAFSM